MSNLQSNNGLRKRLANHTSEIDDYLLWDQISDRIPTRKKRRILPYFWLGIIGVIAVIGAITYPLDHEGTKSQDLIQGGNPQVPNGDNPHPANTESTALFSSAYGDTMQVDEKSYQAQKQSGMPNNSDYQSSDEKQRKQVSPIDQTNSSRGSDPITDRVYSRELSEIYYDSLQHNSSASVSSPGYSLKKIQVNDTPNQLATLPDALDGRLVRSSDRILTRAGTLKLTTQPVSISNRRSIKLLDMDQKKEDQDQAHPEIHLHYKIGDVNTSLSSLQPIVYDGEDGYCHAVRATYVHPLFQHLYVTIAVQYTAQHKIFERTIIRDTIVSSSNGERIVTYDQFANGVIDTKSGVPEVRAEIRRMLRNANTYRYFDIGLGASYRFLLSTVHLDISSSINRSHLISFAGYGQIADAQRFDRLQNIETYIPNETLMRWTIGSNLLFPFTDRYTISVGVTYDMSLGAQIKNQSVDDHHHILYGEIGIVRKLYR